MTLIDLVIAVWIGGSAIAVAVGFVLAGRLRRGPKPPELHGGDVTAELQRIGRHSSVDTADWRPMHTRRAVKHRGRHHTGARCWSGNLVERTGEISFDQLQGLLAGAR